ncbi:uncharacterized protein Tco025E_03634 [Trypanosoma conorhini]|uniref:Uncharacterized protein n=1 Tax=Trypanosoma conorhini TaxID=83891 RepID=A0A422PTF9_9TRYP|nr:uncharacterized protein Tco025E_03634 [Trypanosoma conorhini]RNF20994.1 hypothetical protein Tco025E_03634 [Trypanosoma conorhini]
MLRPDDSHAAAPPATTGGRFPCCITLEDISVDLCTIFASPWQSCVETPCWDEMRVVMSRDGATQCTRWLSPTLAMRQPAAVGAKGADAVRASSENSFAVTEVMWSPLNTAAFTVYFRLHDKDAERSLDPGHARPANLTNLKYLEDAGHGEGRGRTRERVLPKTINPFYLRVECRNPKNLRLGAEGGEKAPTSASVEAVSAYCAKWVSRVSSVFKKASIKLATEFSTGSPSVKKEEAGPSLTMLTNRYSRGAPAFYLCDKNGVDPSEAYNAVGGRRRISLQLFPSHPKLPRKQTGVPLKLHFTMVAHYDDCVTRPVRDYHSLVVLVDQVRLDVGMARQDTDAKNGAAPRLVTGYAFGFTSDTSKTVELCYRSPFLAPPEVQSREEGEVRLVDFSLLHPSQNERELTALDLAANPTSACIVSSGCKVGNKRRIGNRVVLVSRFKTGVDGLCKPSYKCRLVMGLFRRYDTGEVELERCERPLDLASILNQDYYPDKVRAMTFSRGEFMSFRLRRRCFAAPEQCRSELLLPYDYDNSGVEIGAAAEADDAVSFSEGCVEQAHVEAAAAMVAKDDSTTQLGEGNSTASRHTNDAPESGSRHPDASGTAAAPAAFLTGAMAQVAEQPVTRITDSVMTSYNNYEDNTYAPVQNDKASVATDSRAGTVESEPLRDGDQTCVTTLTASNNLNPFPVQCTMFNPFASVSDSSESSPKPSLDMKASTPPEVGLKNPFEEKPNAFVFDINEPKERATVGDLRLVTFEITPQQESVHDGTTGWPALVRPYTLEPFKTPSTSGS